MKNKLFKIAIGLALGAGLALCFAVGEADAKVFLQHKRVTTRLVGAISAEPCSDPRGCARGIVELRWGGDLVGTHHVRCPNAPSLHVVRATTGPTDWAYVYACRRTYRWSLS